MAIVDLTPKQGNVDLVIEIVSKEQVREFAKFGKTGRVCTAIAKDETGQIKLTLWNDDIDKVNVGDKVHITNGYVNEYQGEMQLTTGKFGKLEVVGKAEVSEESAEPNSQQKKKDEPQEEEHTSEDLDVDEENLEEF